MNDAEIELVKLCKDAGSREIAAALENYSRNYILVDYVYYTYLTEKRTRVNHLFATNKYCGAIVTLKIHSL